jgi:caa(3)-type oxidase subunit IV
MSEDSHGPAFYVRIWAILVVLLVISVLGPMLEIRAVTLITAFGIACVKAFMVAANFMHLRTEKRLATYILTTCLVFMFLFFAGSAPDVMRTEGDNWQKPALQALIAAGLEHPELMEHHPTEHH